MTEIRLNKWGGLALLYASVETVVLLGPSFAALGYFFAGDRGTWLGIVATLVIVLRYLTVSVSCANGTLHIRNSFRSYAVKIDDRARWRSQSLTFTNHGPGVLAVRPNGANRYIPLAASASFSSGERKTVLRALKRLGLPTNSNVASYRDSWLA